MFSPAILELAERVVGLYTREGLKIATAESCTGGLVGAALTAIPGSSACFERGLVCYTNAAKEELLGVSDEILDRHGAVSALVAEDMASGAVELSPVDVAVSTTGLAGPGGGNTTTPVGLVFFGLAKRDGSCFHYRCVFFGDRAEIREQATLEALKLLLSAAEKDHHDPL